MGAVFRDPLPGVGGTPHHADVLPALHARAFLEAGADLAQVRVEGKDLQAFDVVPEHNVLAIVGKAGTTVDVSDRAVRRGHHRIRGFAAPIVLDGTDIEPLMHLPAFRAHTAKLAACPRFAGGGSEEFLLAAFLEECAVRGWQAKRLGQSEWWRGPHSQAKHQKKSNAPKNGLRNFLFH